MHNLFRCSCGARVPCGTGEVEYDTTWRELASDHKKMGHTVLKALKIPSNNIEARKMTVHDPDVETADADDGYTVHDEKDIVA